MANTIRIKRRASPAGAPTLLAPAELAYNETSNILYYGYGVSGENALSVIPIGGAGVFADLTSAQTISGVKTFSGASDLGALTIATTAAVNTTGSRVATLDFVLNQASSTNPLSNGTVAIGTSKRYSREDHVHPIDSTRAPLASPTFTGTPLLTTTPTVDDNTTKLASTAFVLAQNFSGTPSALGTAGPGSSIKWARGDHVHTLPTLNAIASPVASVNLNSNKIINLGTPTLDTDAATKAYVDSWVQGLSWKTTTKAATTGNINLGTIGLGTVIDGVTVISGSRVLVMAQTAGAENGIYVASAGAWTRALDADTASEIKGMAVFVSEGTTLGDKAYVLTNDDTIVLGTTPLSYTQMTGAAVGETNVGQNVGTAGSEVYHGKSGVNLQFRKLNSLSSVISIAADVPNSKVDFNFVPGNITTTGTIGTGVWQGTVVALQYGGTGAALNAAADETIFKKSGTGLVSAGLASTFLLTTSVIDGGTF